MNYTGFMGGEAMPPTDERVPEEIVQIAHNLYDPFPQIMSGNYQDSTLRLVVRPRWNNLTSKGTSYPGVWLQASYTSEIQSYSGDNTRSVSDNIFKNAQIWADEITEAPFYVQHWPGSNGAKSSEDQGGLIIDWDDLRSRTDKKSTSPSREKIIERAEKHDRAIYIDDHLIRGVFPDNSPELLTYAGRTVMERDVLKYLVGKRFTGVLALHDQTHEETHVFMRPASCIAAIIKADSNGGIAPGTQFFGANEGHNLGELEGLQELQRNITGATAHIKSSYEPWRVKQPRPSTESTGSTFIPAEQRAADTQQQAARVVLGILAVRNSDAP